MNKKIARAPSSKAGDGVMQRRMKAEWHTLAVMVTGATQAFAFPGR